VCVCVYGCFVCNVILSMYRTYVYHIHITGRKEWHKPVVNGIAPMERQSHSAVVSHNKIFVRKCTLLLSLSLSLSLSLPLSLSCTTLFQSCLVSFTDCFLSRTFSSPLSLSLSPLSYSHRSSEGIHSKATSTTCLFSTQVCVMVLCS